MLCPIPVPAGEATGLCTSCFYCLGHCLSTDPWASSLTSASEAFLATLSETVPHMHPTTYLVYTLSLLHWVHTCLALHRPSRHGRLPWRKVCFYFWVCLQAWREQAQHRSPKNFRRIDRNRRSLLGHRSYDSSAQTQTPMSCPAAENTTAFFLGPHLCHQLQHGPQVTLPEHPPKLRAWMSKRWPYRSVCSPWKTISMKMHEIWLRTLAWNMARPTEMCCDCCQSSSQPNGATQRCES